MMISRPVNPGLVFLRASAPGKLLLWTAVALPGCGDSGQIESASDSEASISVGTDPTTTPSTDTPTTSTSGGPTGTDGATTGTTSANSDTSTGTTQGSESTATSPTDTGPTCEATCDDGICVGDTCCSTLAVCGDLCCGDGEVCSFKQCVVPGSVCVDASDCPEGQYCEYTLGEPMQAPMCMGGVEAPTGKCLPEPPECPPDMEPENGEDVTCLAKCEYKPPGTDFDLVLKYAWGGETTPPTATDVMMTPIVVQLDDDNCDGKINEKDIPEIVFSTFKFGNYTAVGTLHAISIVDGAIVEKWTLPDLVQPGASLAAADLDGDGVSEIVACATPAPNEFVYNTGTLAFRADGTLFWSQPDTTKVHCGYEGPAIGDVDQDGAPEVLIGWTLLDGATGAILQELDTVGMSSALFTGLVDLDGDGLLDVTDGQRAFRATGEPLWNLTAGPDFVPVGYHGIGDFDLDGKPEVAIISSPGLHTMSLVRYNPDKPSGADVLRTGIDINSGIKTAVFCMNNAGEYGGGPPTVADFDGDGFPDVGAAGAVGYIVLSGAKLMDPNIPGDEVDLWFKETHDCSSAVTGSSVFDFDGDGKAEVVYSDEYHLWVYDGVTGENLIPSTCNTTGTLWEYPLVADVDNDGQADIVVASNAYAITCPDDASKQSGIRVFGSAGGTWVRTRRIWNQHTYHVTNIGEDGAVPAVEAPNWTVEGLNNYRQNVQPEGEFAAPDLVAKIFPRCEERKEYALIARVRNIGQAAVPAGVPVGIYEGDPAMGGLLLGSAMTTGTLYANGAEDLLFELPDASMGVKDGTTPVFVVVDDGMPDHPWHECRTDNNKAEGSGLCLTPK